MQSTEPAPGAFRIKARAQCPVHAEFAPEDPSRRRPVLRIDQTDCLPDPFERLSPSAVPLPGRALHFRTAPRRRNEPPLACKLLLFGASLSMPLRVRRQAIQTLATPLHR